jgi:class 3 adenylate cyclase
VIGQQAAEDPVARGRDAVARGDWAEAYEVLAAADRSQRLGGDGLALLADAAYMTSRPDSAIAVWERAHAAALASGDKAAAAGAALWVTIMLLDTAKMGPLRGWQRRLDSLLEGLDESAIHAGAEMVRSFALLLTGDVESGLASADTALAIAQRVNDRATTALAMNAKARHLLLAGRLREGLELLEESAVAALSGEIGALGSGVLYCSTICACQSVGEYERAEEWTTAMERWTHTASHPRGFHGRCRIHRAQIELRRGDWDAAAADARAGAEELRGYAPLEEGWGLAELGLVRLRMGDLDGAQHAFDGADAVGWDPQPGLALLRLARGDVSGAARSIAEALDTPSQAPSREVPPNTRLRRAPLLEAQAEIAAGAGDVDRARWAADELQSVADELGIRTINAAAAVARGRALLAAGDAAAARQSFQNGARIWQELGAPYETARARLGIARAARAMGNDDRATSEARAARQTFERLGARLDARSAAAELGEASATPPNEHLVRRVKVFVFTDIVRSTDLVQAIGDEAWRHLLRWHDETIRSLVAAHRGSVVSTSGDGFFLTFDSAVDALGCAVEIQRSLDEHRRRHGFAPYVRIGLHRAEATLEDGDWIGSGVHLAARIGALADAGQIVASRETADVAGQSLSRSAPESVSLKGFAEPIEVVRIGWARA